MVGPYYTNGVHTHTHTHREGERASSDETAPNPNTNPNDMPSEVQNRATRGVALHTTDMCLSLCTLPWQRLIKPN